VLGITWMTALLPKADHLRQRFRCLIWSVMSFLRHHSGDMLSAAKRLIAVLSPPAFLAHSKVFIKSKKNHYRPFILRIEAAISGPLCSSMKWPISGNSKVLSVIWGSASCHCRITDFLPHASQWPKYPHTLMF
jgi:hypothetical protein